MTLEEITAKETKFGLDNRSCISKWWTSRSWWDWFCHVPKSRAPKHKEEFKEGMEIKGKLGVKTYGPIRRTAGAIARTLEFAALYASLGVGYIYSAQAYPRETHNLTDWASVIVQNVQREGARVIDWVEAVSEKRWPSSKPMTDRFKKNDILGPAGPFNAPLAYAISIDQIVNRRSRTPLFKYLFSVSDVNDLYMMYSVEDVEKIVSRLKTVLPKDLVKLANARIPVDQILNPEFFGLHEEELKDCVNSYLKLIAKHPAEDIRRVAKLIKLDDEHRYYKPIRIEDALRLIKAQKWSLSELEKFGDYDIFTIFLIKSHLSPAEQDLVLKLKPSDSYVKNLITSINLPFISLYNKKELNESIAFFNKNFAWFVTNPIMNKYANSMPTYKAHHAVKYLSLYAFVNGLDNISEAEEFLDKFFKSKDKKVLEKSDFTTSLFTKKRLAILGVDKPKDEWISAFDFMSPYGIREWADLIDNGVSFDFALEYALSQHGVDVSGEECKAVYRNFVKPIIDPKK